MIKAFTAALLAGACTLPANLAFAQSGDARPGGTTAPSSQGPARATAKDFSSGSSGTGTAASGAAVTTEGGNPVLDSNVRGDNASTSDRDTSRTWTGVGSTGGATGTGVSSGTINDPVDSSGRSVPGGANDGTAGNASSAPPAVRQESR
jgi:hypothetical protein